MTCSHVAQVIILKAEHSFQYPSAHICTYATYPSLKLRNNNSPEIGAYPFAVFRLPWVRAVIRHLFDSSFIH